MRPNDDPSMSDLPNYRPKSLWREIVGLRIMWVANVLLRIVARLLIRSLNIYMPESKTIGAKIEPVLVLTYNKSKKTVDAPIWICAFCAYADKPTEWRVGVNKDGKLLSAECPKCGKTEI